MSSTTLRLIAFCCAINWLSIQFAFGQFGQNETNRNKTETRIRQGLAEEFPLILKEDKLTFEFPDREKAQLISQAFFPNGGGGSSSYGINQYSIEKESGSMKLVISSFENESRDFGFGDDEVEVKRVALTRTGTKSSSTEFLERNKVLQCSHFGQQARELFVFRQDQDGIRVVFFDGNALEKVEVVSHSDLVAYPKYQAICKTALTFGFQFPFSISSDESLATLTELLMFTQTNWDEFMQEFADLQSNKFAEREAATKKLTDCMSQWKIAIIWGMSNDSISKETKSRLLAAIKANSETEIATQIHGAVSGKLLDNVPLLIELLSAPMERTKKFRPALITRLTELTGEPFGDNVDAWKQWSEEKGPGSKSKNKTAASSRAEASGAARSEKKIKNRQVDLIREELAQLLTLGVSEDGKLEVDRKNWGKLYGDKSVMELVDQLKEDFKKTGLPNSWLELGGGYDVSVANHSHLLFARLEEAIENTGPQDQRTEHFRFMNRRNSRMHLGANSKDLNRQIQSRRLSVAMRYHDERQFAPEKLKEKFFQFSVVDSSDDSSRIELNQRPDGEFSLLVVGRQLDPIVLLGQSKDRKCWINILSGSEVVSVSADSASELFEKNESELKKLLFPILRGNGINLNSTLGGPLEIKNEERRARKKQALEELP